jgi:hypothetical protein
MLRTLARHTLLLFYIETDMDAGHAGHVVAGDPVCFIGGKFCAFFSDFPTKGNPVVVLAPLPLSASIMNCGSIS